MSCYLNMSYYSSFEQLIFYFNNDIINGAFHTVNKQYKMMKNYTHYENEMLYDCTHAKDMFSEYVYHEGGNHLCNSYATFDLKQKYKCRTILSVPFYAKYDQI